MQYEVELKFSLPDPSSVLQKLTNWDAELRSDQTQIDQYFAHPLRDFSLTDEALRIRSVGDANRLTYKGPVVDRATKTRHESELGFESGAEAARQLAQIWEILGFRRVRTVEKFRRTYHLTWHDHSLEICFDQVEGLGSFLEIETLASAADKANAQQVILTLAAELGLGAAERRSYLEMLIARD